MLLVNTPTVEGKRIIKHIGLVRGSTIKARHLGHDILAFLKMLIGGEIKDYTKMMAASREEALQRMQSMAEELGANAIVNIRFSSVAIMSGTSESLAYGTAVLLEDL